MILKQLMLELVHSIITHPTNTAVVYNLPFDVMIHIITIM